MRHVIIGAGAAGVAAAKAIRKCDGDAEISLLCDERCFPYHRYRLVDYLCGHLSNAELFQCRGGELEELGIKLRQGQRATRVLPGERKVHLEHGEAVSYDRLLIATGRCATLGAPMRPYARHIQSFYTLEDARILRKRLARVERVVVYGSGLSTLDLVRALLLLKKKVMYVLPSGQISLPLVEPGVAATVDTALLSKGVEVLREDRIVRIVPLDPGYRVTTQRGQTIDTDLVCGVMSHEPNLACIRETGIETQNGILVDACMRTTVEYIYAAGDCVEVYHPGLRNYWINFGWPNAVKQGAVAGMNMADHCEEYRINETLVFNLLGQPFAARWWK